jgi:fructokinase
MRLGALEAGGTKMVCAVGTEAGEIIKRQTFPTETPEITVERMLSFFKEAHVEALGIGCFGPLDLHPDSPSYGRITTTPKLAWVQYNILEAFQKGLGIPVSLDTDVNCSALGEAAWGASKGLSDSIYITIGTGVGMGIITNGALLHGMLHPEGGHILLSKHPSDTYAGCCPYHSCCLEGMASGPATLGRWGQKGAELANRQEVWELEAYYIGQALISVILLLSPMRIILGGGIMHQEQLMPLIRREVTQQLGGYLQTSELANMEQYIVRPDLGDDQGILGALRLAASAMQ